MHFHQENQPNFDFNFHETQTFEPEYLPEVITPYFINKSTISQYSKQNWARRFFGLPRMTSFVLDSLEKNNEFSLDLHNSIKQTQYTVQEVKSKVDKLNDKFLALEGTHGDFRPLINKLGASESMVNEKLRRIEEANKDLITLKQQMKQLKNNNRFLWVLILISITANMVWGFFFFIK